VALVIVFPNLLDLSDLGGSDSQFSSPKKGFIRRVNPAVADNRCIICFNCLFFITDR
jgi:Pyruvate/2-oxoacid:ferredoxin oxidoreductase delta subunit